MQIIAMKRLKSDVKRKRKTKQSFARLNKLEFDQNQV